MYLKIHVLIFFFRSLKFDSLLPRIMGINSYLTLMLLIGFNFHLYFNFATLACLIFHYKFPNLKSYIN
jgi:hypothetical protein